MFLNFITAMAWLWGGMAALSMLCQLVPPIKADDVTRAVGNFVIGMPAFAWLIARYCL